MKRLLTVQVLIEVDASAVDPTVASPDGFDWRFARVEERAALALQSIAVEYLGSGMTVRSSTQLSKPYDPDNEPF